jgi:hypothetical protein
MPGHRWLILKRATFFRRRHLEAIRKHFGSTVHSCGFPGRVRNTKENYLGQTWRNGGIIQARCL